MGNFISGNIVKIIYESNSGPYKVGIFRVRETNDEDVSSFVNKLISFTGSFNEINSDVDILSFMVETHKNIDGRCDVNRGISNILNDRPTNFNIMNSAYD